MRKHSDLIHIPEAAFDWASTLSELAQTICGASPALLRKAEKAGSRTLHGQTQILAQTREVIR